MPDYIDQIVDGEAYAEEHAEKQVQTLSATDKELLDEGVMTKAAAEELTNSIRAAATATYILVKRAHDGKAWKSLGYDTWEQYVTKEFDMTTSRSYQLINQANVIKEIESVVPDGTPVSLTEKEARDIKAELPRITKTIKDKTSKVSPDEAASTVGKIVSDARAEKKEAKAAVKQEKEEAVQEDSFAGLDSKRSSSPDRLSSSNSGSTADEDIDLDADVAPSVDADFSESNKNADDNPDVWQLQYIFSSFSSLGNPYDVAGAFKDAKDKKTLLDNVDGAIKWLQSFQKSLK